MEERYFQTPLQEVHLNHDYKDQSILDIGGGGEGFIGQMYGKSVIAIDTRLDELEETRNEAIKLVMDARQTTFVDNSFDVVTLFYSLMYMDLECKKRVMKEALRVLKPGGIIDIHDVSLPAYDGGQADIFVAHLKVCLNDQMTKVSYGVSRQDHEQDITMIRRLMLEAGFTELDDETIDQSFRLRFKK